MATPSKGKAKVKVTSAGKKVSYGQAGNAKDGSQESEQEHLKAIVIAPEVLE